MRAGIAAFVVGMAGVQGFPTLPPTADVLALTAALGLLALRVPAARPAAAAALGFSWALAHAAAALDDRLDPALEGRDAVIEGEIMALPQRRERATRARLRVTRLELDGARVDAPGRVRLSWYGPRPPLAPGERWRLHVRLKRPRGFMNPGGFDYEGWLLRQRLGATGYVRRHPGNRRLAAGPVSAAGALHRVRARLSRRIAAALEGRPRAGLVEALAVGRRDRITPGQWETLRRTGTAHLVAISGLHIGLLAGLAYGLIRWLWARVPRLTRRWPAPVAGALGGLLAAAAYAALAGASIPTQRALAMVVVTLGTAALRRPAAPSRALAAAALVVLVIDPLAVLAPGFWLSFAAVAGLLFALTGRRASGRWRGVGRAQVIAAAAVAPLTLYFFQQAALIAPLANLVAVPWVSLAVVPLTLLGTALVGAVPAAGGAVLALAETLLGGLWPLLEWLADRPLAYWAQGAPPLWALGAAGGGLALLLAPRGLPGRWLGLVLCAPLLAAPRPAPVPGGAWFTLLDVGQGLAAVLRTRGHVLVYDTGPRFSRHFDTGRAVVLPYLRHLGVRRVDVLVVSHGDNDHRGGVRSVLEGIEVGRVLTSVPGLVEGAATCAGGQRWAWDGVAFEMLYPPAGERYAGNDTSCVLRVTAGGRRLLLTGDIERGSEARLRAADVGLDADVLVVPHHGSATSSTPGFVRAVAPRVVLFPVGHRNRFGFPKPEVVARYRALDARLMDSARHGAITIRFGADGRLGAPEAYRERGRRYWTARGGHPRVR